MLKVICQPSTGGVDKLQLIRSKKNSGGCAVPRNIGMKFAYGDYFMFVDSDDAITKTALEELYSIAKKFDADVVQCDRYYSISAAQIVSNLNENLLKPTTYLRECQPVSKITILDDPEKRLSEFRKRQILWNAWGKLIRRNLIIENDLQMIGEGAEDMLFTSCLLMSSKIYLRVPNVISFYRETENSITRKEVAPQKALRKWTKMLADAVSYFENFCNQLELSTDKLNAKYLIFETFAGDFMNYLLPLYAQIPAHLLDQFVRKELDEIGNSTALTAFLFARMNIFNVQLNQYGAIINQMNAYIQQQNQALQQQQEIIQKQAEQIKQLEANVPEKI